MKEAKGITILCSPSETKKENNRSSFVSGGSERIRTFETVASPHDFESCAFNHSATLPSIILS